MDEIELNGHQMQTIMAALYDSEVDEANQLHDELVRHGFSRETHVKGIDGKILDVTE